MEQKHKKLHLLIYVALALTTIIAFEGVRHNGFVFDDTGYITQNENIQGPISIKSVIWAFKASYCFNWHPLTWLSHMLDYQFFGLKPAGHHLVNLFFHTLNTLFLFAVLKKMTSRIWPCAFIAAAFALHPVHVESVAWIAERKDVLSTFFFLLTIAAYISYAQSPNIKRFLLVILLFALGLLAKPMLVTLPCVLLLLDYWPLQRFSRQDTEKNMSRPLNCPETTPVRLILEKVPLFALSLASSIITFLVQQSTGAVKKIEYLPISLRIANTLVSYVNYIAKIFYPTRLAVFYPHPGTTLSFYKPLTSAFVLIILTAAIIYLSRKYRFLLTGWLWYLGTLIPVIGLVQVGGQSMADRYTYIPSIGLFIMISFGIAELTAKWRYRKIALSAAAALVCVALIICTRKQVKYWQDDFTLYGHAIEVTNNNHVMYYNLGNVFCQLELYSTAVKHFQAAIEISPNYAPAYNREALAYLLSQNVKQAVDCWNKLLILQPKHLDAMTNLAWVRATHSNPEFRDPNRALDLALSACEATDYNQPYVLDTLAASYAATGRFSQAVDTAGKALRLAQAEGQNQLVEQIKQRLDLYKDSQPYIDSSAEIVSD